MNKERKRERERTSTHRCTTAPNAWRMLNVYVHCHSNCVNMWMWMWMHVWVWLIRVGGWLLGCICMAYYIWKCFMYTQNTHVSKCIFNIRCCVLNFRQDLYFVCIPHMHTLMRETVIYKQFCVLYEKISPPTYTQTFLTAVKHFKKDNACVRACMYAHSAQ